MKDFLHIKEILSTYKSLPKQIKVLYFITLVGELYLIIPIWMFFYLRYISYEQIALITIIQQVTSIIFEVPTGAFADIFGKKITLIIAYILYALSLVFMPFGNTFIYFAIFEIIRGIAKALISGSFEALTYDSLKEIKLSKLFPAVTSQFITISWFGYIIAGILGGILYDIWFGLPYIILGFFYTVNIVLFFVYIKEPHIDSNKVSLKNYLHQNTEGFKELFSNSRITILTITLVLITMGYYTASELLGISQGKQYGFNGSQVGLVFTGGYIVSVILSSIFPLLLKKYKTTSIILSTSTALLVSFLFAKFINPIIGASLIVLRISSSSTFSNIRSVTLNENISSKNRSTALSSFALIYEVGYVIIAYFAGWYIQKHSPNDFAFVLGLILLFLLIIIRVISYLNLKYLKAIR